jgi:hypothetical protein
MIVVVIGSLFEENKERVRHVERTTLVAIGTDQGRIQDFKLGGGALKKIAPSRGRRENFWGISCEKSRFYAKKNIFFSNFRGGARRVRPPLWIRPCNTVT